MLDCRPPDFFCVGEKETTFISHYYQSSVSESRAIPN